jgi:hypothetical protein
MEQLLEIARQLRDIFGIETEILKSFSQDDNLRPGAEEVLIIGEGITDGEVGEEVDRILRRGKGGSGGSGRQPLRVMNVSSDEHFDAISTVVKIPFDPEARAVYVSRVARHARQMRQFFQRLGLGFEAQRMRVKGRSIDRSRLRSLVVHGDPRMLVAREPRFKNDVFIGVLVDCSGSMQVNERIEHAKRFAAMIGEAVKGVSGMDVRVFGFTDSAIYDAGDALHCAAHGLKAGGGNNDAAALWHAAQVAMSSRRRTRLLIMISDGSPSECSTTALTKLVNRLTIQLKILCAQVAVRPLDVICFPYYVEVQEDNMEVAVKKFGAIVARLVLKAIGAR